MDVLIIIGAFQAIFFAVLVLSKKGKSVADKILAAWLSTFAIHLSFVYYSFQAGHIFYINYGYFSSGVIVLYYSLMYLYAKSVISEENIFKAKWLLHLIPTAITYIFFIPYALLSYEEKADLLVNFTTDPYLNSIFGIIILFATIYLVATLKLLKKHKVTVRKMFSYEENINLNWLRILALLFIFLWIIISGLSAYIYYLEATSPILSPKDQMTLDMQGQTAFVIFVFLLGYFGIKQQIIYSVPVQKNEVSDTANAQTSENRYRKSGLKKEDAENHLDDLLNYMEKEKPYLNGKLSLKEVAENMGISTNHLSQVINENLNKNFFDFVNGYRIELVKQKMNDPANKNYTLLFLAYECGFNSKSSFNSMFKKLEGITPTQFRNKK